MNNLTEYELLQHRHLSLLRELQDKGVTCVMGKDGWEVTMPHAPEIQIEQYSTNKHLLETSYHSNMKEYGQIVMVDLAATHLVVRPRPLYEQKCPVDFSGPSPFGGHRTTSAYIDANAQAIKEERLATAKHPASKDAGQWAMTINVDEKTHKWGVAIGDTMHIGLPYTSLMAGLLSALHAAIMDATSAKA